MSKRKSCEICGTDQDLRCVPIMTGDTFDKPPQRPICSRCVRAWYEGAGTTPEEIRRALGLEEPKP